ncbi:MAG: AI-2E family transporter [candidate division Zixibacteria bacterium]|nr:AI-2E family transporter [candidate division Zixibacteria bacterium]
MQIPISNSRIITFLLVSASVVVIVAGMRAAETVLVPFLLATFIAIIAAPPLMYLRSKRVPAVLALLIIIIAILLVGALVGTVVGTSVHDFTQNLPRYQERLQEQTRMLQDLATSMGIGVSDQVFSEYFDIGAIMQVFANMLASLGGMLTNGFFILLTVMFMLLEVSSFQGKLNAAFGRPDASFDNLHRVLQNIKRYMAIKTIVSLGTGVIIGVWVWILGVDYPILWGLLAFLLNYVPNIGSIIAAVPAVLLAFIQLGTGSAALTAAGYLAVNSIIGNLIEPRFMGRGLGLSTLVVFMSLIFWGWVLGPVGMLLSVPLTMTVKIGLQSNEDTQWLAILLGDEETSQAVAEEAES